MHLNKTLITFLFLSLPLLLNAQQDQPITELLIEEIAQNSEKSMNYSILYEDLEYFLHYPLDINNTTQEELQKLHILTDFQIRSLLEYIEKYGKIVSLYELKYVYGFSKDLIDKIKPFITIKKKFSNKITVSDAIRYGNHQLFLRSKRTLEEQTGYQAIPDTFSDPSNKPSHYLGNPYNFYTSYRFACPNKLYAGFTSEKDAGETFFSSDNPNGFDFYSAHLQINNIGKIKKLTVGDYHLGFGQGLILWTGMSFNKTSYVLSVDKFPFGIRRSTSANENSFMRGAATTLSFNDIEISAFFSRKNIDGNITSYDSTDHKTISVSSLQASGYHATKSQIADENALEETLYGTNITIKRKHYQTGITYVNHNFNADVIPDDLPYNKFRFSGNRYHNAGLHYKFFLNKVIFFGELATMNNFESTALINGSLLSISSCFNISLVHRSIEKNYTALYSNPFTENSQNNNEKGLYIGSEIHPFSFLKLSAYFDTYEFPWLKYQADAPSYGDDYFIQAHFYLDEDVEAYIRFKSETKQANTSYTFIKIPLLTDINKKCYRFNFSYSLSERISLKNRMELMRLTKKEDNENGYLLYQDINYHIPSHSLTVYMRYAIFDTDSYLSRIYSYENDLLYSFSFPSYYLKGSRTYLMLKYSLNKRLDSWFKISRTFYNNTNKIGTSLNQIDGNTKTDISLQLRLKI